MNIDKRYVEILLNFVVRSMPETKKSVRISVAGFLLLVAGGILALNVSLYSLAVAGAGVAIVVVGIVKQSRTQKQLHKSLLEDYEKTGALPPYPEDKK